MLLGIKINFSETQDFSQAAISEETEKVEAQKHAMLIEEEELRERIQEGEDQAPELNDLTEQNQV